MHEWEVMCWPLRSARSGIPPVRQAGTTGRTSVVLLPGVPPGTEGTRGALLIHHRAWPEVPLSLILSTARDAPETR